MPPAAVSGTITGSGKRPRLRTIVPQHSDPGEPGVVSTQAARPDGLEVDQDVDRNRLAELCDAELRPDERKRDRIAGGVTASPTITTSESATPGPAVAATIALPALPPVTSPVLDTVATFGAPLVQVASEGDSCFPAMSVTTAVSCAGSPG